MSKPIAYVVLVLSLTTLGGCIADGGASSSGPRSTRDGPRGDVLSTASDDVTSRSSSAAQSKGPATTDAPPDDGQPQPRDTGKSRSVVVGAGAFAPRMTNIQLGDAVEFSWQSGTHSVTSGFHCKADGMFASGNRTFPAAYRVTFLRTGIFPFYSDAECETMSGMITVTAPPPQ